MMKKQSVKKTSLYVNDEFSNRFKRRINRKFREYVGFDDIPHPDVDNFFERFMTKVYLNHKQLWNSYTRALVYCTVSFFGENAF